MSLSNKALLSVLSISQWTGRRLDKRATETVEHSHSTEKHVGQYTKKLLPAAKELEEVHRLSNNIRQFFYEQSLPWYSDGSRIISAKNYLDFTAEFRKRKADFDYAVEQFIIAYPDLRESARQKLGDLFNETQYPSVSYLRQAFNCEISFMPLPDVKDFRVDVSESEKATFLKKIAEVEATAMKECWSRLFDTVSKAAHRMSDPSAILRDSLLENVREICALLPKLNISDDPTLESMRQAVESTIASISTDECRQNKEVRSEASKALDDITAKMGAFMGYVAPQRESSSQESSSSENAMELISAAS